MSTISENLQSLQIVKQQLKSAIESKGQNLENVPFTDYPSKIVNIQDGGVAVLEIEMTSTITNASQLKKILFENIDTKTHNACAFLSKPKNETLVDNQVVFCCNCSYGGDCGFRHRNGGIYIITSLGEVYDVSVTIGDIYKVFDLGEVGYGN